MASPIWPRLRRLCLLTAVVGSVAGCVGMPSNGPAAEFTATPQTNQQENNFPVPIPSGPPANGTPSQVVDGFLLATSSPASPVAGQYLTGSAARNWNPTSVRVFSGFTLDSSGSLAPSVPHGAPQAFVNVTVFVQATLNGPGQYVSAQPQGAPTITYRYILVKVDGQWRIRNPPPYRLVNEGDLLQYYKQQDLYFFDGADDALVPDSVFVPLGLSPQQLATDLVDALAAKPATPWLANAADTELPAGTKVSVTVDGPAATVNLGGGAASASPETRALISAQLVWTLTSSPGIQSVALEIDGKPFTPAAPPCAGGGRGQGPYQTQATYQCFNPYLSAPASFYYVNQGQLWSRCGAEAYAVQASIGPLIPVVGRTGAFTGSQCASGRYVRVSSPSPPAQQPRSLRPASMAAVSPDGKYLAIVSSGKDQVFIGQPHGPAASFPNSPRMTGSDITALSWDHSDQLWVAQGGTIFMVPAADGKPELAMFTGGNNVTDLSVAPDGVRIAIIESGNGPGRGLLVAAIEQGGPEQARQPGAVSVRPPISPAILVGPNVSNPISLTWYGADDLIVVNQASSGNTLWEVPVDGQPAQGPLATPASPISISADGPANVLVAGLSGTRLAVSAGLEGPWQALADLGQEPVYP